MFSDYLTSRKDACRELVNKLGESFAYVAILGADVKSKSVRVNKQSSDISEGAGNECGFVIKLHNGKAFFEYSLDDIKGNIALLAGKIIASLKIDESLTDAQISVKIPNDEPLKQSFTRDCDYDNYTDSDLLARATAIRDKILGKSEKVVNAIAYINYFTVSKLFITKNRELDQFYSWANVMGMALYRDNGKMVMGRKGGYSNLLSEALADMEKQIDDIVPLCEKLVNAKPITPGVYDCITDLSITGLIAHEAFGHGVEMDQFVKDRALAKHYVGKYVASPICNMHDGAAAAFSTASYFFDDDGVLAQDTQIIKDGILVAGISDLTSATELGTEPTGNGRRQSYKRKAYSRMTNTFFSPGKDKLEDMIASIKHGYMLFDTNNGMEDPKNWQIQCTAEYGIEIIDGKLTDNYVSPVVMSGSVPELLKSISMVSDDFKIIGAGSCGKGYKEWVRVSDGGPALKVKVKLA